MKNLTALYLDQIKKSLLNQIYIDKEYWEIEPQTKWRRFLWAELNRRGLRLVRNQTAKPSLRAAGLDVSPFAHTMIGEKRLNNIVECTQNILAEDVPGDFIETGVWRGGATILMRALLKAHGVADRTVWVADSFAGLPPPNPEKYPEDASSQFHTRSDLSISLEEVQENFRRYDLLDEQVKFLKGWFKDTLPRVPIQQLSLLRLDGDMYESTIDALQYLYPKLSVGGYCIIDDYEISMCRKAVQDYRNRNDIKEAIRQIDQSGVFWKKLG